ncbi:MAG: hypothetical protein NC222_06725 [Staphylococcus sp.]|nr:hypothetical protein [Staphylococcus sp.]
MKNIYFWVSNKDGSVIGILGKRKPIKRSRPYIVRVYDNNRRKWAMACFQEIYWNYLVNNFSYIGKTQAIEHII